MSNKGARPLWKALDFKLSEILRLDFYIGLIGGIVAGIASVGYPDALLRSTSIAASVVGVILGAVVAGLAVQTAFMDQPFLRKIRAIGRSPIRYLAPFIFTATVGVFSMLGLIILGAFTPSAPKIALSTIGSVTGFLTFWAIASLLPGLATLVQFIGLKVDALNVPDEIEEHPTRSTVGLVRAKRAIRE